MKIKVDFNKLVWGYYRLFHLDIELAMINWLFKTGLQGDGYQERHGWYRSGINQLLYGYSGNDELYHTESFPIHDTDVLDGFIRSIFVRAFLAPYSSDGFRSKIDLWREKNKIDITKYRYLDFPQRSSNNTREFLLKISEYQGSELKRHLFHRRKGMMEYSLSALRDMYEKNIFSQRNGFSITLPFWGKRKRNSKSISGFGTTSPNTLTKKWKRLIMLFRE